MIGSGTTAALLPLVCFSMCAAEPPIRIGAVEFFGTAGLDMTAIRQALPVKEDDQLSWPEADSKQRAIKSTIRKMTGQPATDVTLVCCDERQSWILFVGLPGGSVRQIKHRRAPNGAPRLPADAVRLYEQTMDAVRVAAEKGPSQEDDSRRYALSEDPGLREKQRAMRAYALKHESSLMEALARSRLASHRRAAAHLLGYSGQSPRQIAALVNACDDLDSVVRNNAIRALSVLAKSGSGIASRIAPEPFIGMLLSGSWTDRNKAAALLDTLTGRRDPDVLRKIRLEAGDSLKEMAGWRNGYGVPYARILGRAAGVEENRLQELIAAGQVPAIVRAFEEQRK